AGKNERVRGQVTGTRTRVLGTGDWLTSVNYYDDKYRLIQTVSDGYVGGAVLAEADRVTTRYDFTGKPLETLTTHRAASGTHAVLDSMRYDHMGRLLESWQAIDGRGAVLLASNKYNEAGQLVDKGLHSTDGGGSFLQSVDYRYNIRGWTSSINNAARTSDGATNDEGGDLFGFELTYNEGMQLGAGAQYNGNVTEAVWSTATDGVQRGYAYAYDRASRLKSGTYKAYDGAGWTAEQGRYTLEGLSYDANGNIKGLVRHGMSSGHAYDGSVPRAFGEVDRLSYVYEGNRLATVNDAVTVTGPAGDFRDNGTKKAYAEGNQASWEYAYDANGNMVRDENKGITSVSYNHLNLPDTVFVKDKGYIRYLYSAAGVKLRKEVYQNSALTSATDYAGVFVHQADTLFAFTPEGRALYEPMTDQVWRYEYHLKDHLGNLRVSFAEPTTTTSGLTMEPMMATTEEAEFENVEQTRHQDRMRARTGSHSALLGVGRGRPLGPSKRVALQKGDTLRVEAFGMYEAERKQSLAFSLASWLASGVALTAPQAVAGEQAGQGKAAVSPLLGVGLAMAPAVLQREKRAPVAYLRYIVYDSDSNYVDSGYRALSSEANGGWEELELAYAAEEDGFAEVYVANESEEEAYFDDMSVSVTSPMLVQENHYDPWGLNLVGLEKQGTPDHKFQYNGKEKQTELGLNWMDYGARMYDAQIGRWHVVDPLADIAPDRTPYHFVSNNPINRIDPTGLTDFTLNKKTGEVAQVGKANDEPDRILKTNRKGEVKYKKNGEAKVAMGGIEQGILADGQNWKTDDQVIEVGGEGQATVDGVKSFTMGLSEYLGKEIKGFSYSSNASGDVTDMVLGKYLNNSNTESYGTLGALQKKYGGNFSFGGVLQEFHTHPDGKLGATQSAPNLSQDVTALQNDKPFIPNASFIILYRIQGQKKPAEYDYTHEYRVPRKKR
ncbi:RHS repeat-associated protein, partial [Pontibacter ummariensis]